MDELTTSNASDEVLEQTSQQAEQTATVVGAEEELAYGVFQYEYATDQSKKILRSVAGGPAMLVYCILYSLYVVVQAFGQDDWLVGLASAIVGALIAVCLWLTYVFVRKGRKNAVGLKILKFVVSFGFGAVLGYLTFLMFVTLFNAKTILLSLMLSAVVAFIVFCLISAYGCLNTGIKIMSNRYVAKARGMLIGVVIVVDAALSLLTMVLFVAGVRESIFVYYNLSRVKGLSTVMSAVWDSLRSASLFEIILSFVQAGLSAMLGVMICVFSGRLKIAISKERR